MEIINVKGGKKNLFYFLVVFIVSLAAISCGDDDDDEIGATERGDSPKTNWNGNHISRIVVNQQQGMYVTTYWFQYDSQNRVTYLKVQSNTDQHEYFYGYSDGKLICTTKFEGNSWKDVYNLNKFGYIIEGCTYDSKGNLTSSTVKNKTYSFNVNGTEFPSGELNNDDVLDLEYLFVPNYYTKLDYAKLIGLAGNKHKYIQLNYSLPNNRTIKIDKVERNNQNKTTAFVGKFNSYEFVINIYY